MKHRDGFYYSSHENIRCRPATLRSEQNNHLKHPIPMTLVDDVTFESLGAVREELRAWLGSAVSRTAVDKKSTAQRDVLISVLIHHLAQELGDVHIRSKIQALLSGLVHQSRMPTAD